MMVPMVAAASTATMRGIAPSCPATSLIMGLAVSLLNDTLKAEKQVAAERGAWAAPRDQYDVVVVGGGSAGCVLAARLSEDPGLSVLLLEAGGEEPASVASYGSWYYFSHSTAMNWGGHTAPSPTSCGGHPDGCHLTSGRGLGGASAINGMQYVRALPQDLDGWARSGLQGWGYRDVLPYFKKSERNVMAALGGAHLEADKHGTKGPLDVEHFPARDRLATLVLAGLQDRGLNYTDACAEKPAPGVSVFQSTVRNGQRRSANLAFLEPARNRPNLDVLTHAHVVRVLLNSANKATGVAYRGLDGVERQVRARREVVLSAGALRSPQVLMLSGIGPRAHLEEHGIHVKLDLPVGETFQDMPYVPGVRFLLPPALRRIPTLQQIVSDLVNRGVPPHRMASDSARRVMGLFAAADPLGSSLPDVQLRFSPTSAPTPNTPQECPEPQGLDMYYDYFDALVLLMGSPSFGKIRLSSRDPLAPPEVHENFFGSAGDLDTVVTALQWVADLANTSTFRTNGITLDTSGDNTPPCRTEPFGTTAYWRCVALSSAGSTSHFCGSCAMGTVVDERLRVRGAKGLRVVDASAMPRAPRSSTYATTLMLAEKASDMIKQDLGAASSASSAPAVYKESLLEFAAQVLDLARNRL